MANVKDLSGEKFGRLTVLKRTINYKNGHSQWICKCECGKEVIVRADYLKSGKIISCGCFFMEKLKNNNYRRTHNMTKTRLYNIWAKMKVRCYNPKEKHYNYYGERGIKICEEWKNDFMSFYKWSMENGYRDDLTIDRIDVNGNYEPSNCRWADKYTQANNQRNTIRIEYKGRKYTLREIQEKYGINSKLIDDRLRKGWSVERTIETPVRKRRIR